jgi:hypothetical protein
MSQYLLRISMLGLFLAVAGAGAASAATVGTDSWADAANITVSGVSSTDTNNTLVPESYEFWKD